MLEPFDPKCHWEKVYQSKKPSDVSWYQAAPSISLDVICSLGIKLEQKIIDVGGGASVLADKLLEKGFKDVSVLDISAKAMEHAKERLQDQSIEVTWIEEDITQFKPSQQYDLWHDRAVFHFLTNPCDRKKYTQVMRHAVKPRGYVVIAAFSLEGPAKCSGLNVERYNSEKLSQEIGDSFHLIKSFNETHITPMQTQQKFLYCIFQKNATV